MIGTSGGNNEYFKNVNVISGVFKNIHLAENIQSLSFLRNYVYF